jgi:hypothetical protein
MEPHSRWIFTGVLLARVSTSLLHGESFSPIQTPDRTGDGSAGGLSGDRSPQSADSLAIQKHKLKSELGDIIARAMHII